MDKAGGGLAYRLRVVPPHVTISRLTRATLYLVIDLNANTRYTVYVRAVSSGVYGPEESAVGTTGGSECLNNDCDEAMYCLKDLLIRFDVQSMTRPS